MMLHGRSGGVPRVGHSTVPYAEAKVMVIVPVRLPQRRCYRARVLTSQDLLPKAPQAGPLPTPATPNRVLRLPSVPLQRQFSSLPRVPSLVSLPAARRAARPLVAAQRSVHFNSYTDDWISQTLSVDIFKPSLAVGGADGQTADLTKAPNAVHQRVSIAGQPWLFEVSFMEKDAPVAARLCPILPETVAVIDMDEYIMLQNVRCSVALIHHQDSQASPKKAEEGLDFLSALRDKGWRASLATSYLDSEDYVSGPLSGAFTKAGHSQFAFCFLPNETLTVNATVQVWCPMPSGALSGDMVLETEDGEAHLVHSLFVERLSPSLLGPKVAAARAQYGPGGRLSIKCPGSTREVRLLQQLLYAEERNEWVKIQSFGNLLDLSGLLHKVQASSKIMALFDTELASRSNTYMIPAQSLPFLTDTKGLPCFAAKCKGIAMTGALPTANELSTQDRDTVLVYVRERERRVQGAQQQVQGIVTMLQRGTAVTPAMIKQLEDAVAQLS